MGLRNDVFLCRPETATLLRHSREAYACEGGSIIPAKARIQEFTSSSGVSRGFPLKESVSAAPALIRGISPNQ